jgi:hypothetical protein
MQQPAVVKTVIPQRIEDQHVPTVNNGGRSPLSSQMLIRPLTGREWSTSSEYAGHGGLRVENGTEKDGVAVLFDRLSDHTAQARSAVYVRAGEDAQIQGVAAGSYTLRFVLGTDWDDQARTFRRDVEGHELDRALDFTESNADGRIEYSEHSVTLHKVVNGNMPSSSIDPNGVRFDQLGR